jgi:putative nucleotidyltransferase with HDIG domain
LLIGSNENYINSGQEEHRNILLRRAKEFIKSGHFKIIEIYNKNKELIIETAAPKTKIIKGALDKYEHRSFLINSVDYKKFYVGKTLFLQIFVPLMSENSQIIGFFEGGYEVSQKTLTEINQRILWSLIQAVIVILATTIMLYPIIVSLNKGLVKRSVDLSHANIGMLKVLGSAISKRDAGTSIHNYHVTILVIRLAEKIGLKEKEMKGLIKGAFLHDLGKIGISDNILNKPAALYDDEIKIMKKHVQYGLDIIKQYEWLNDAKEVVNYHHEKYNGKGYPKGLAGESIPINARIFSIADVFDSLISKRPYKPIFPFEKTMDIMNKKRGNHFDPVLFDAFNGIAQEVFCEIRNHQEKSLDKRLDNLLSKYFQ